MPSFHDPRAARAEPELKPSTREALQRHRLHREHRRCTSTDLNDARDELDSLGAGSEEGERGERVVTPSLRNPHRVDAETLCLEHEPRVVVGGHVDGDRDSHVWHHTAP